MFQIYINYMQWGVTSYMSLFANDDKLMKVVKRNDDYRKLQEDINRIYECSKKWKLKFNVI